MPAVSGADSKPGVDASAETRSATFDKKPVVEKIKKAASLLFIILGLGLAEIGATLLDVNLVAIGASFVVAAIGLIVVGLLKIREGFQTQKNDQKPVENKPIADDQAAKKETEAVKV
ncbi:MAG: hypothetical protein KR126chlam6_00922 [Candidatus Anoxychlamydiales bacterium]|nr:hypothetical protein [Candidatus Anoxychlamydiales bacterium]